MSEITVIIPSYNAAMYLPYVMTRLQHQKIPNLPVIVMDNGSTDGTSGLCGEWMARNYFQKKSQEKNAINFFYMQRQQSPKDHPYVSAMKARSAGARMVKTPYVFFLDADVLIRQNSLPKMLEFLQENNLAYCGMRYEPDSMDLQHIGGPAHIMMGATLWKKEIFLSLPECTNEHLRKTCDCNFCYNEVKKMGHKAAHFIMSAEHCKGIFV